MIGNCDDAHTLLTSVVQGFSDGASDPFRESMMNDVMLPLLQECTALRELTGVSLLLASKMAAELDAISTMCLDRTA